MHRDSSTPSSPRRRASATSHMLRSTSSSDTEPGQADVSRRHPMRVLFETCDAGTPTSQPVINRMARHQPLARDRVAACPTT